MLPHAICAESRALAALARTARPSLAGHARSLWHLALRSHAAADPGEHGDPVLRALHPEIPDAAGPRACKRRASAGALERPRLLRTRAQPASRGAADRAAWLSTHRWSDRRAA